MPLEAEYKPLVLFRKCERLHQLDGQTNEKSLGLKRAARSDSRSQENSNHWEQETG